MISGIAYDKGAARPVAVNVCGSSFAVESKLYRAGARALQLSSGICVFPLVPAFASFEEWRAWVTQRGGPALPGPLQSALGSSIWLAASAGKPCSLSLEDWTRAVQHLEEARNAVQIAVLMGVVRNKEAAKAKKGAAEAARPAVKAKHPAKRAPKKKTVLESDSEYEASEAESHESSDSSRESTDGEYQSSQDSESSSDFSASEEESDDDVPHKEPLSVPTFD